MRQILKPFCYLAVLALACGLAQADDLRVTRHFSGVWDQVENENQGLALQVVHQDAGDPVAGAYWFTFASDRQTAWYVGVGPLAGDEIDMDLYLVSDVGFLQPDDPGVNPEQAIGTMHIRFEDCNRGTVTFDTTDPEVGSGRFLIERLAWIHNTRCSGGISDDFPAHILHREQRMLLEGAREGVEGRGYAGFESSPGHSEFGVEVRDLPDGSYRLRVGGVDRGGFMVAAGRGEIEFRSPGEAGRHLLTFDPRGQRIEVADDSGVALTSGERRFQAEHEYGYWAGDHPYDCVAGAGGPMGGGHGGGGPGGGMHGIDCVDEGELLTIEIDLVDTGVIAGAKGEAEWEMSPQHVAFDVEISDVPEGFYSVHVGGVERGLIGVRLHGDGDVRGRLRLRDPQRMGSEHLDFDPRGQAVEVRRGAQTILETLFPGS